MGLISLNAPVSLAVPVRALGFDKDKNFNLDLREEKGRINIQLTASHDSLYKNYVGLYQIDDINGTVDGLKPSDGIKYTNAALKRSIANVYKTEDRAVSISAGALYAPYLIANGTLEDFFAKNPTNAAANASDPHAYFSFIGANPDGKDHIKSLGADKFGFEDMYGGGDNDFNDAILQVKRV